MIHSVEKRHGKSGSGKRSLGAAVKYVLSEKDHNKNVRNEVTILEGNPELILALGKNVGGKNIFLHTSLAFTDKETEMLDNNPNKLAHIVHSYKEQLAVGLPDPDRLEMLAVLHREESKIHIHFLSLRCDTLTMKNYEPFVVQRGDIARFNVWNQVMQHRHGLENPNGTDHKQGLSVDPHLPGAKTKNLINEHMMSLIKDGTINSRDDIIKSLNAIDNIHVSRQTKSSISITIDSKKQPIRLSGELYNESFTSIERIEENTADRDRESIQDLRASLKERMSAVSEHHRETYQQSDTESDTLRDVRCDSVHVSNGDRAGHSGKVNDTIRIPDHKIFKNTTVNNNIISWHGDYGSAEITINNNGIELSKGNVMEWRMAAQIAKENRWPGAVVNCQSEHVAKIAYKEFRKAGISDIDINIDGQKIDMKELKNEYKHNETDGKNVDEATQDRTSRTLEVNSSASRQIDASHEKFIEQISAGHGRFDEQSRQTRNRTGQNFIGLNDAIRHNDEKLHVLVESNENIIEASGTIKSTATETIDINRRVTEFNDEAKAEKLAQEQGKIGIADVLDGRATVEELGDQIAEHGQGWYTREEDEEIGMHM